MFQHRYRYHCTRTAKSAKTTESKQQPSKEKKNPYQVSTSTSAGSIEKNPYWASTRHKKVKNKDSTAGPTSQAEKINNSHKTSAEKANLTSNN